MTNDTKKIAVDIWLARCPACGSADLHHYGTRKNAAGEVIRYYVCRSLPCVTKFAGRIMNVREEDEDQDVGSGAGPE